MGIGSSSLANPLISKLGVIGMMKSMNMPPMFATHICKNDLVDRTSGAGHVWMGGWDSSVLASAASLETYDLVTARGYYALNVTAFRLGSVSIPESSCSRGTCLLDSTSSEIVLPSATYALLISALSRSSAIAFSNTSLLEHFWNGSALVAARAASSANINSDVSLSLSIGSTQSWDIFTTNFISSVPCSSACLTARNTSVLPSTKQSLAWTSADPSCNPSSGQPLASDCRLYYRTGLAPTSSDYIILGLPVVYNRVVQFDLSKNQVHTGFADSGKCSAPATLSGMVDTANMSGSGVGYIGVIAGLGGSAAALVTLSSLYVMFRTRKLQPHVT
ncbi:hypothetical protein SeMB42_g01514 [Synchytrium endobioticum]|nr:hypothetical protein SeMB42_g01514 [Synchytrium endobioticum]